MKRRILTLGTAVLGVMLVGCSADPQQEVPKGVSQALASSNIETLEKWVDLSALSIVDYNEDQITGGRADEILTTTRLRVQRMLEGVDNSGRKSYLEQLVDHLAVVGASMHGAHLKNVKVEGDIAVGELTLELPRYDTTVDMGVRFRRGKENWQLIQISAVDNLDDQLTELEKKFTQKRNEPLASITLNMKNVETDMKRKKVSVRMSTEPEVDDLNIYMAVDGANQGYLLEAKNKLPDGTWLLLFKEQQTWNPFPLHDENFPLRPRLTWAVAADGKKINKYKLWDPLEPDSQVQQVALTQ